MLHNLDPNCGSRNAHTGITFQRIVGKELHGNLTIWQNNIDWRPKGNEFVFRVSWDKLADFAKANGKRVRPKATALKAKKKLKPGGA
jgi:hypothetical protein